MSIRGFLPSVLQHLAWVPLRLGLTLFCRIQVRGVGNVVRERDAVVIAANHISEMDPLIIVACLPFFSPHLPLFFAAREKSYYAHKRGWKRFLYGGTFFRMMGAYPVYAGLNDYHRALRNLLPTLTGGRSICIFPSGTRTPEGASVKAKGGAVFLARETNALIVPVLIEGASHLTFSDFLRARRNIAVTFGKPIRAGDLLPDETAVVFDSQRNDYDTAAAVLMEKITQLA